MDKDIIKSLSKKFHFVDSSLINGCSVRVHDNPLFQDCIVDGRLCSDLEFAFQNIDNDNVLKALSLDERPSSPNNENFDTPYGTRHVSLCDVMNTLRSHELEDVKSDLDKKVADLKSSKDSSDSTAPADS